MTSSRESTDSRRFSPRRLLQKAREQPGSWTGVYALVWALLWFDWLAWFQLPEWLLALGFTLSLPVAAFWMVRTRKSPLPVRCAIATAAYLPLWHWTVFVTHALVLEALRTWLARLGLAGAFVIGLAWVIWYVERASQRHRMRRHDALVDAAQEDDGRASPLGRGRRALDGTSLFVATGKTRRGLDVPGRVDRRLWNPLDADAWFFGRRKQKLNQSLTTFVGYSVSFLLIAILLLRMAGCQEIYEMPAGGGEQKQMPQVVKIHKVIRQKFVINPFSAIIFNPPPIDDIKLQLLEITKHAYTVGYGKGTGAGFSGGTRRGKVRFIRLEYAGGDWDQDFGVGADLNMLIEYGVRTGQKIAKKTESRKIAQLKNFPVGKSPPMVYMTGQRSISLSRSETKILREYLIEKHGMIFADNGGSWNWHGQFFNLMRRVLPRVEPVRVPLDDVIHRIPYPMPFLPYVAPHGGKDAWGWKVDGRWVAYYHPGDIGDAWSDGHAGIRREIWEACFQLGVNLIFYAHVEYNKWLDSRRKD
jgi:hypothetical protein